MIPSLRSLTFRPLSLRLLSPPFFLFFFSLVAIDSAMALSLETRLQNALALLPPSHRLPPQENESFGSWNEGKTRLQDYAFTQGFALVTETNDKKNHIVILECTRHHKKERNTRKLEEKDRKRKNTKVAFNDCKYRLRLKRNKEDETWRLYIVNPDHNHEMARDPFSFKEHQTRDPERATALEQGKNLRVASTNFGQAARVLGITGLRLSRNDYYNLTRSMGKHTPEEELNFALGSLDEAGFHVRTLDKYIVENNTPKRRIVDHFFCCNAEQIRFVKRFVGFFMT